MESRNGGHHVGWGLCPPLFRGFPIENHSQTSPPESPKPETLKPSSQKYQRPKPNERHTLLQESAGQYDKARDGVTLVFNSGSVTREVLEGDCS